MFPILLELGPLRVLSYWAFILIGGVAAVAFWRSRRRQMGLTDQQFWLLINVITLSLLIGGRILFALVYIRYDDPDFWAYLLTPALGGFSILGALLGVFAGIALFCRVQKISLLKVMDYIFFIAPLWHGIGRIGCFAAGCCYGRPAPGLSWAVTFTDPRSVPADFLNKPLHPTQLYEVLGNALIMAALYTLFLKKLDKGTLKPGTLTAAYFACYGIMRFIMEFYRGDVVPLPGGITSGQAFSMWLLALSLGVLTWRLRRSRRSTS